jgi:hypothetical protein
VLGFLAAVLAAQAAASAQEIRYDGTYSLAPNGDMAVTIKLVPPMVIYQKLRESISNLYLVMRGFASSRANAEVVEKKADWDDSNRTLSFSMKILGAGHNLGDRWEVEVPKPTEFSNLDEAKRTFYFNESAATPAGTIRGISKLILPAEAKQFKWEESRRVASYVMPPTGGASGKILLLWIAAVVFLGAGAALTVASFVIKPAVAETQSLPSEGP